MNQRRSRSSAHRDKIREHTREMERERKGDGEKPFRGWKNGNLIRLPSNLRIAIFLWASEWVLLLSVEERRQNRHFRLHSKIRKWHRHTEHFSSTIAAIGCRLTISTNPPNRQIYIRKCIHIWRQTVNTAVVWYRNCGQMQNAHFRLIKHAIGNTLIKWIDYGHRQQQQQGIIYVCRHVAVCPIPRTKLSMETGAQHSDILLLFRE